MINNIKRIIFILTFLCGAFITVVANASVFVEDFTNGSQYLTVQKNDTTICYAKDGSYLFDFSSIDVGSAGSRYVYQKYMVAKNRLYIDFDFELTEDTTFMVELRNYDNGLPSSSIKGSYSPFILKKGTVTFADRSVLHYGKSKGRFSIDVTADSKKTATIKVYLDNNLIKTYTVPNFPLESQLGYEYRIRADANRTSEDFVPMMKIDNLKVVIDETEIPSLYARDPEFYFDYGDNRFLKSENTFTFYRVNAQRQIANFTTMPKTFTNIIGTYNEQNTVPQLASVKSNTITLNPGEVVLASVPDELAAPLSNSRVDYLLWHELTPVVPKSSALQSTVGVPAIEELKQQLESVSGIHPRLLVNKDDISKVALYRQQDSTFDDMYNSLLNWKNTLNSGGFLTCPMPSYNQNVGNLPDIIYKRALVWGYLWQTTKDETYASNLVRDMLTVANYDDWYYKKQNFLITAHIANAMAIGYDFTFDYLSRPENVAAKEKICYAIHKNAILPALEIYREDLPNNWHHRPDNWNMICNGGIAVACMAIGENASYRDDSAIALNYALRLIEDSFEYFAPEGAWVEGLGYYGYMMSFGNDLIATLTNSFGKGDEYGRFEGFLNSASDPIKLSGSKYIYSYSDADASVTNGSSTLSFFGKFFGRHDLGFVRRDKFSKQYNLIQNGMAQAKTLSSVFGVKDVIWYIPEFCNASQNAGKDGFDDTYGLEKDTFYKGTGIIALHSDYSDTQAFAAANCGINKDYHTHIDMGSFVYEANGEQWFTDLGLNNYSLADCFNKQYYRLKPEGHNCLVFNPAADNLGQAGNAQGSVTEFHFGEDKSWFVMDITSAYADSVSDYKRLIYLDKQTKGFAVKDKFTLNGTDNEFYWFAHTSAQIELSDDKKTATLSKPNGKKLKVVILGEGTFEVMEAKRLFDVPENVKIDPDPVNTGISKLSIHSTDMSGECEITVAAVPDNGVDKVPDISKINF